MYCKYGYGYYVGKYYMYPTLLVAGHRELAVGWLHRRVRSVAVELEHGRKWYLGVASTDGRVDGERFSLRYVQRLIWFDAWGRSWRCFFFLLCALLWIRSSVLSIFGEVRELIVNLQM